MAPGSAPAAPSKENVGLMLGDRAVGPSLAGIKDEIDLSILMEAVRTVFAKGTTRLTQQEAAATMQAFASAKQGAAGAKNREEGNAFLAKNKTEKGVITTASGLQYMVLRQGSGERPMPTNTVRVNYEGKLLNGQVFDSSYQRGQPAEFGLNQVIAGWTEGVALMPVGSKYRFWIPSNLAYGPNGTQGADRTGRNVDVRCRTDGYPSLIPHRSTPTHASCDLWYRLCWSCHRYLSGGSRSSRYLRGYRPGES